MLLKRARNLTLLLLCGWLTTACGIFSDDEEVQGPAELQDFNEEIELDRVWRSNIGNGQGDKYNRLAPALAGNRVFVASNNGNVIGFEAESGRRLWRTRLDHTLSGGVGIGEGLVLVGTEDSLVIALSLESGEVLWEAQVASEVLSRPQAARGVVVVQSIDGTLTGLNASNGERRWLYESTVPVLSLRGTSSPLIVENFVLAALANGSVVSVALDNGTLRWEERVAIPTGRSEIDRLVDIDGELSLADNGLVYAPSYQGNLAAVDVVTGQSRWRAEESSTVGAAFGFGNVYVVSDRDLVKAYRIGQPTPLWTNDQFTLRQLSQPTAFGNYLAVADFEGYVHFLSQVDGRVVGRVRVDRSGVRAPMVVRGDLLFVYGNNGNLVALRVE